MYSLSISKVTKNSVASGMYSISGIKPIVLVHLYSACLSMSLSEVFQSVVKCLVYLLIKILEFKMYYLIEIFLALDLFPDI